MSTKTKGDILAERIVEIAGKTKTGLPDYIAVSKILDAVTDYRKPQTININGIEVPEPMREKPEIGTEYYAPSLGGIPYQLIWRDDVDDKKWIQLGICHLTREAAERHSRALLSFTKKEETK